MQVTAERIDTQEDTVRSCTPIGSFLALSWLACGAVAHADATPSQVCADVAKAAKRTLWNEVRETGDALFCRKSWVPGRVDELAACGAWTQGNLFGNKLKNAWNRVFSAAGSEWASWGPRGISADWEQGTIRGGFKRTFFGAGIAYSTTTAELVKEGGRAAGNLTVCVLDYEGDVVTAQRRSFERGTGGEHSARKIAIEHKQNAIVGVVVDTPVSVDNFEYRVRLSSEPIHNDLGPVKGIADLHVHQLMNLAFAGRMYWGQHSGPKSLALAPEVRNPSGSNLDLSNPDALLEQLSRPDGVDANLLMAALNPKTTDEGFFQYGGEGASSYRDWLHHADRSHQQVHIDWVKAAHDSARQQGSGLNLMVVSAVNNNVLCSVLKTVDPFGNVPVRDNTGRIVDWESKAWGCSDHENVVRQIRAIHQLEQDHPWYRVAMSPWHARQIISEGDLAVVISMETDKPLSAEGNNYGSWEQQLDHYRALGLSTLQVVHESDSRFAGAALHRDMMIALQAVHWPIASISNLLKSGTSFTLDERQYNRLGLTSDGKKLVDAMMTRNMPIDLAHMSARARKDLFEYIKQPYALYDSHTKFERLMRPGPGQSGRGDKVLEREQEFMVLEELLPKYMQQRVLVGLRTASVDVYAAPHAAVANDCPGSAKSFAQLVQYAYDSGLPFAYGTDFNTGVSQLGPRFGKDKRCFAALPELKDPAPAPGPAEAKPARAQQVRAIDGTNYYDDGLAHIGWLPELTEDLIGLGTPGATRLRDSAEAYLQMWERAYSVQPTRPVAGPDTDTGPAPGSVALGGGCSAGDQCHSGRCSGALGMAGVCVCNEDRDCSDGKYCDAGPDLTQNACRAKQADNESCPLANGGHACRSGHCQFARCYSPNAVAAGGVCYVDAACAKGKCSSVDGTRGSCVCKSDDDCGPNQWCKSGLDLTKNVCMPKLNAGEVCGAVGDVGVGHRCKSGKCKLASLSTQLKCK
jgi:hypothetical protein